MIEELVPQGERRRMGKECSKTWRGSVHVGVTSSMGGREEWLVLELMIEANFLMLWGEVVVVGFGTEVFSSFG